MSVHRAAAIACGVLIGMSAGCGDDPPAPSPAPAPSSGVGVQPPKPPEPATEAPKPAPPEPTSLPAAPVAQEPTPRPTESAPKPANDPLKGVPPSQRLGFRVALVRSRLPVNPVVVLVPDARSYVAAVGAWNFDGGVRFPVLIDDGSWPARTAIARFVRAFSPKSVARWHAPEGGAWPADPAARRALIERAAAAPWGVAADQPVAEGLKARWKKMDFTPPGLIVANAGDPVWTAALALGAGRGQPIAWLGGVGKPDGYMSADDAAGLEERIEQAAEASGYTWSGLGDDLDALTICLNCCTKVFMGEKDSRGMLSLSDWLGRKAGESPSKGPTKDRWAWAGQVIGSEWSGAYAAMCSLFLTTERAWLFDGYDAAPPWNLFDMTEAATVLEKVGIKSTVDDDAGRSLGDWRRRGVRGVDAGLICVNTSGNQDFFDLKPGQARPVDVPILRRPAITYFVHSWSAAAPSDPATVAGRWLERGVYLYAGSVHEPYLQAFVPTPKFVQRLVGGLPFGAAARIDGGDVWKISILGDPLTTISKAGPVVNHDVPLEGAADVAEDLGAASRGRDFTRALTDLLLLGRDGDAGDLLGAVLHESKGALTPEAALAGMPGAFFNGDENALVAALAAAQSAFADEAAVGRSGTADARDMLWHALWPKMGTLPRDKAQLLGLNLRQETLVRDAGEAFAAVRAAVNKDAAQEIIERAKRLAGSENQRRQVEQIGK